MASDDATFGLPELDRGALGAATHLARLVPQHLMRTLYYTSRTATAAELQAHGSVWKVVPRAELQDAALELAGEIARKDGYDDLFCEAADAAYVSCERLVGGRAAARGRPADPAGQAARGHRRRRDPERRALHLLRPGLRPRRGLPEAATRPRPGRRVRRAVPVRRTRRPTSPQSRPGTRSSSERPPGHDRDPRRVLRDRLRRRLARQRRGARQPDGPDPVDRRPARQAHLLPRSAAHRR